MNNTSLRLHTTADNSKSVAIRNANDILQSSPSPVQTATEEDAIIDISSSHKSNRLLTYASLVCIVIALFVASTIWSILFYFIVVFGLGMACGNVGIERVVGTCLYVVTAVRRPKHSSPLLQEGGDMHKQQKNTSKKMTIEDSHSSSTSGRVREKDRKNSTAVVLKRRNLDAHREEYDGDDYDSDDDIELDTRDLVHKSRRNRDFYQSSSRSAQEVRSNGGAYVFDTESHLTSIIQSQVPRVISGLGEMISQILAPPERRR